MDWILLKGIITAYEVQVNLVKVYVYMSIKLIHIAHLGPSVAVIGAMLKLNTETIYQSIQQAYTLQYLQDSLEKGNF